MKHRDKLRELENQSLLLNYQLEQETAKIKEQVKEVNMEMDRIKKRILIDEMNDLTDVMNTLFQNEIIAEQYKELANMLYDVMQEVDRTAIELEEEWEEEVNNHYNN
jgi:methionyl-tRNA synthetase